MVMCACDQPPSFVPIFTEKPLPQINGILMPDSVIRLQFRVAGIPPANIPTIVNARVVSEGTMHTFSAWTTNFQGETSVATPGNFKAVLGKSYQFSISIQGYDEVFEIPINFIRQSRAILKAEKTPAFEIVYQSNTQTLIYDVHTFDIEFPERQKDVCYLMGLYSANFFSSGKMFNAGLLFNTNMVTRPAFEAEASTFPYRMVAFRQRHANDVNGLVKVQVRTEKDGLPDFLLVHEIPESYLKFLETANLQYYTNQYPYAEPVEIFQPISGTNGILTYAIPLLSHGISPRAKEYLSRRNQ